MDNKSRVSYSPSKPSNELIKEAKRNPNGWVYVIDDSLVVDGSVPPEAVVGAWKVDHNGNIEGEFLSNPSYKGSLE